MWVARGLSCFDHGAQVLQHPLRSSLPLLWILCTFAAGVVPVLVWGCFCVLSSVPAICLSVRSALSLDVWLHKVEWTQPGLFSFPWYFVHLQISDGEVCLLLICLLIPSASFYYVLIILSSTQMSFIRIYSYITTLCIYLLPALVTLLCWFPSCL